MFDSRPQVFRFLAIFLGLSLCFRLITVGVELYECVLWRFPGKCSSRLILMVSRCCVLAEGSNFEKTRLLKRREVKRRRDIFFCFFFTHLLFFLFFVNIFFFCFRIRFFPSIFVFFNPAILKTTLTGVRQEGIKK